MKLNKKKVQIQCARKKMSLKDIESVSTLKFSTISRATCGRYNVSPKTIGCIAEALNCDVEDILADDEEE